jgi:ferredoxin
VNDALHAIGPRARPSLTDAILRVARPAWAWLGGRTGRKADRSFRIRAVVQSAFAALCVLLGFQLAGFVAAARRGALPLPTRPAGVDGFLPISGLMGVVDWLRNGDLNRVHPAATVLLLAFGGIAFLLRKAFCSWICPVGLVSELLARLGRMIFGRNFRPWKWLDLPLRGVKYFLLLFFAQAILRMSAAELRGFLDSPYNRVADIKMGLFFADLGPLGWQILVGLAILSVLVNGVWCRYLCPYGALLGLASWASPTRIRRDPRTCIDCKLCDRVCMARLPVARRRSIRSAECTGCLDCVAVCPVKGALEVRSGPWRLTAPRFAAVLMLLFLGAYGAALAGGAWRNAISDQEYVLRVRDLDRGGYAHPGIE